MGLHFDDFSPKKYTFLDFNFLAYIGRSQKLLIFGGTSIYAQFVPNFGQVTLEAMSESGQKGKLIRQLDQNSGHSNVPDE